MVDTIGLVLGLVRADAFDVPGDTPVEAILQPGPRTIRPSLPAADLARLLREDHLDHILVTTADGRLVGLARRDDLEETHG